MTAKTTPNIVATAPARIYLVIGEDVDKSTDFADLGGEGITWCEDKIDGNSIEYVRAALAGKPAPRLTDDECLQVIFSCGSELQGRIALTYRTESHGDDKLTTVGRLLCHAIEAKVRGE